MSAASLIGDMSLQFPCVPCLEFVRCQLESICHLEHMQILEDSIGAESIRLACTCHQPDNPESNQIECAPILIGDHYLCHARSGNRAFLGAFSTVH